MSSKTKKYIIILGICAFWFAGIPFIFPKAVSVICENISYNSNYNIEIVNPKMHFNIVPTAVISAQEINISGKNTKDNLFIKNPSVKIRLLPLLSGRVHINKISSDNIEANIAFKKKISLKKDFFINLQQTRVFCDSFNLKSFNIKVTQENINKPVLYTGKDIIFRKSGQYIRLNLDSQIKLTSQQSDVKANLYLPKNNDIKKSIVDVNVTNIDIAPFREYFINYLPSDLKDLRGLININVDKNHFTAYLKNAAVIMQDDAKSVILPKLFTIKSDFNLTRKTLTILNSEIFGENISANVNGTVSNYVDKSLPSLNLNIRINKSKTEDIIKLLPPIKVEDINLYKLKKYKFYGDVIGNFSIKGDIKEPSIYGNVYINNGVLIKPIPNARGASIKLSFMGKYLNYDATVPANSAEKVWVKGEVELYNVKYADLRVWSTKNVDLALAEEKIIPIHEILNFVLGPVPIMNIKGLGNIDITVKGNRQSPHIWGQFETKNAEAAFIEMPDLVLKNADSILTFDDELAIFTLIKGLVNNKDFKIKGTCTVDGKFDFDVSSNGQELRYLYNAIKTSAMVGNVSKLIPNLTVIKGLTDLKLKVFGNVKYIEDLKFQENLHAKGQINFKDNTLGMNGVNIEKIFGFLKFDDMNINSKISSYIGKSPLSADLNLNNSIADLKLSTPYLKLSDIVSSDDKFGKEIGNIIVNADLQYKGNADKIEYGKINLESNILGSSKENKLQISNGKINIKNGKLNIKNLNGKFLDTDSTIDVDLTANDFQTGAVYNGSVKLKNFELPIINSLCEYAIIPENIRSTIKKIRFDKGRINLNANIRNNNINASTDLGGIGFTYTPLDIPVKIINGSLYTKKDYLGLNKINLLADGMPILLDGGINNIFGRQDFKLYVNSKPKQEFIDKYINNNRIYPIKIKGDIVYWAKFNGIKDDFNLQSEFTIAPDSSIYYLGAHVGDVENAIVINLDMNLIKQNILKIKEFSYDKIISSLSKRQTRLNMLKAKGGIDVYENDLVFHDLKIKTSNPTDARIFNIIFRKPNIKQGQFTSDLKINGNLSNPNVLGNFHIFETNIPFLDTIMKNITFNFNNKTIELISTGEILGNDIKFKGTLKNKLSRPYYIENAELFTKVIDLNYLTDKIKMSQVDSYQGYNTIENFKLSDIVIKRIKMTANGIKLRNLIAENVEAEASINEKQLIDVNHFKFDIANGSLNGNFRYNMPNGNTVLGLKAKDINANDITLAIFDLNNQIYGDLTGDIKLSCIGTNFNKCLGTLNGKTTFEVSDGRMPKLGSLEYLLKAGNLVKGGLTGISINSIIDIITPLKTGEFSQIIGRLNIKDGIADEIEISTRGKDLNLFISGTYNFSESNADMEVLGLLSKKISTMFGPLGNVSLNTLLNVIPGIDLTKDSKILENINKIPAIELSEKSFRKFAAQIKGNINGDNYVKSFEWIN